MAKFDAYQTVTNKVIELMETHGTNWSRPWAVMGRHVGLQHAHETQRPYEGLNQLLLMWSGYGDNRWGTYKAWQRVGGQVRGGEKGTAILKPNFKTEILDDGSEHEKMWFTTIHVFNAEQCDGVPEVETVELPEIEKQLRAEHFVKNTGAVIRHGQDSAFYSPALDYIGMPNSNLFKTPQGYYSTLLHELTHWTLHKDRCNRDASGSFGSAEYAFEELVAELGATFACVALGIESEPREDHAQYLNSWIRRLKDDKTAITRASSQAKKAFQFLEGLQPSAQVA